MQQQRQSKAQDDELLMGLVEMALQKVPSARRETLEAACGGDTELFARALGYVEAEERMQGFLTEPLIPPVEPGQFLEPGALLDDRFRIVRRIDEGGMGVVYEAYDERLGLRIALKGAKAGFRKRLPPEVRHAREVAHPNVCKIFEIHTTETPGGPIDFLTMEYLEGPTLSQYLRKGPIPEDEASSIAAQICAGLAEAHRRQVIHGDLKSNNIILTVDSTGARRAVITDFGLACEHGKAGLPDAGTPQYMAPELRDGGNPSFASDLYALGVILHELAFGRRPDGLSEAGHWNRAITECLHENPQHRPATADEVRALLRPKPRYWLLPVAAALLLVVVGAWKQMHSPAPVASIAVLPFLNVNEPGRPDYLSEGVTEDITNALSQVPGVRVAARNSAARFPGPEVDATKAARDLGVDILVEGQVRSGVGEVEVVVGLLTGKDGKRFATKRFRGPLAQLAGVGTSLAGQIASELNLHLTQAHPLVKDATAYAMFLRGQYQQREYSREGNLKAAALYEQALAREPSFAMAHAELADVYRLQAGSGHEHSDDNLRKAEGEARRALASDPNLAEAHAVLGDVFKDRWEWVAAEPEYRRALELNPNLVRARLSLAIFLSVTGRHKEALDQVDRALQLDPLSLRTWLEVAAVRYNARSHTEALKAFEKASTLDPAAGAPIRWMGIVHSAMGNYGEALKAYEEAVRRGDDSTAGACYHAFALARDGKRDAALALLDKLRAGTRHVSPAALAAAHLGLGDKERAFLELDRAVRERDPIVQYFRVESHFDELRSDPRYQTLADRIGLPR